MGHAKLLLLAVVAVVFSTTTPSYALNVGIHTLGYSGDDSVIEQQCSRTCESEHCTTAPLLRYGKYCGIMYTGCPGEEPCDALDACCMIHDACVQTNNDDYLNTKCNQNLLNCLGNVRDGGSTFKGNKCMVEEVVDVIAVVIEAAVLAGRVLHKP
ncbi:phospholipase A2 homolog 3-like [Typha latifolia]|uniref:phospholipase A2 homolog 3-like n=1 Tax=Typha latifolia TaxID=4733 RepID=UPI003C2AFAA5